jgi:hypothetical protein
MRPESEGATKIREGEYEKTPLTVGVTAAALFYEESSGKFDSIPSK